MTRAKGPKTSLGERILEVVAKFLGSAVFGLLVSWVILGFGLNLIDLAGDGALGWIWIALVLGAPVAPPAAKREWLAGISRSS